MFFTVRYSSWASDFGGKVHLPAKGKAFQGCSNRFERLKRYLAVSLRTQTSAFGRMRELPSEAVGENTDRQSSSLGCKIRQNIHPKTDRNDATSCHVIEK